MCIRTIIYKNVYIYEVYTDKGTKVKIIDEDLYWRLYMKVQNNGNSILPVSDYENICQPTC